MQLQGLRGTDVPSELRLWARMFIESSKKIRLPGGATRGESSESKQLHSFRFPGEDLKQTVPRIRRDMELIYDRNALEAGLVPDGNWFKWQNATSIQGYQPSILQHTIGVAACLGLMVATTAILSQVHDSAATPQRLVFCYLFPLVLITLFYSVEPPCFVQALPYCALLLPRDPVFSFYTSEWAPHLVRGLSGSCNKDY